MKKNILRVLVVGIGLMYAIAAAALLLMADMNSRSMREQLDNLQASSTERIIYTEPSRIVPMPEIMDITDKVRDVVTPETYEEVYKAVTSDNYSITLTTVTDPPSILDLNINLSDEILCATFQYRLHDDGPEYEWQLVRMKSYPPEE